MNGDGIIAFAKGYMDTCDTVNDMDSIYSYYDVDFYSLIDNYWQIYKDALFIVDGGKTLTRRQVKLFKALHRIPAKKDKTNGYTDLLITPESMPYITGDKLTPEQIERDLRKLNALTVRYLAHERMILGAGGILLSVGGRQGEHYVISISDRIYDQIKRKAER